MPTSSVTRVGMGPYCTLKRWCSSVTLKGAHGENDQLMISTNKHFVFSLFFFFFFFAFCGQSSLLMSPTCTHTLVNIFLFVFLLAVLTADFAREWGVCSVMNGSRLC